LGEGTIPRFSSLETWVLHPSLHSLTFFFSPSFFKSGFLQFWAKKGLPQEP
jgi:hypothetical protein